MPMLVFLLTVSRQLCFNGIFVDFGIDLKSGKKEENRLSDSKWKEFASLTWQKKVVFPGVKLQGLREPFILVVVGATCTLLADFIS